MMTDLKINDLHSLKRFAENKFVDKISVFYNGLYFRKYVSERFSAHLRDFI